VLYVYAITDVSYPPPRRGLRGAELRSVGDDGLFAIVSEHPGGGIEANEENLWAHEDVVEGLLGDAAVLPLRLASLVANEDDVRAMLRERRSEFRSALEHVRGAVELGVRVELPEAEHATAAVGASEGGGVGPGTAYMLKRLDRERRAADTAARIHRPLAGLARDSVRANRSLRRSILAASYLVDIDRIDAFRDRVDELSAELDGGTIVCTGPWPPYSFSSPEAGP
jgi:Gas vesicle synthesis protein GvpL/GvpF